MPLAASCSRAQVATASLPSRGTKEGRGGSGEERPGRWGEDCKNLSLTGGKVSLYSDYPGLNTLRIFWYFLI
ncbi:unnamed protein product [Caretta caretta]